MTDTARLYSAEALARLEELAGELRNDNPDQTFVVDSGCVWLRHEGVDYAIASLSPDGLIVASELLAGTGRSVIASRPSGMAPEWRPLDTTPPPRPWRRCPTCEDTRYIGRECDGPQDPGDLRPCPTCNAEGAQVFDPHANQEVT